MPHPVDTLDVTEPPVGRAPRSGIWLIVIILILGCIAYVVYSGVNKRVAVGTALKAEAERSSILAVKIVRPTVGAPMQEIVLPGNVLPYGDTPIYARTSGYLRAWHFDIGSHVKRGQLLVEIEAPEVDKQLQQVRAELATAEANLNLARSTAERWQALLKTNSVARQETDEKIAAWNVQKTSYEAVASNVRRLEDLQSFQKIYAPFDGVITARNTDVGALISEGSGGSSRELFHLSDIRRLRVVVNIPQVYAGAARPGTTAAISLQEKPGQKFYGKLARTSNSIDPLARTLLTEFEVNNESGALLPGSYVSVHLKLSEQSRAIVIPSAALLFRREGLRVGVVRDGRAYLVPITIGRDFGDLVEVSSGLAPDAHVIADPADSLSDGAQVRSVDQVAED